MFTRTGQIKVDQAKKLPRIAKTKQAKQIQYSNCILSGCDTEKVKSKIN